MGTVGSAGTPLPVADSVVVEGTGSTESEVICFFAKKPITATTKSRLNTPKINRMEFLSKITISASYPLCCMHWTGGFGQRLKSCCEKFVFSMLKGACQQTRHGLQRVVPKIRMLPQSLKPGFIVSRNGGGKHRVWLIWLINAVFSQWLGLAFICRKQPSQSAFKYFLLPAHPSTAPMRVRCHCPWHTTLALQHVIQAYAG